MLGDHCNCTKLDFLGKILFGQKRQNMLKNDHKIGFYLYFEKFCRWFLLETYLNKNWYCYLFYCTNQISGEILVFELLLERLWSHISPDRMTGSHFLHGDSQKRKKISTKFSIVCGAQRLLKSCSVTEKSIEWKINWKEETFHVFLIHNLSRQVLLSYEIAVFLDQLEVCKDYCFSFLLCVLGDA